MKTGESLRDFFAYDDIVRECGGNEQEYSECDETEMEIIAQAAKGRETELCGKHHLDLLKSFILQACIDGVKKAVKECPDIVDLSFVEFGDDEGAQWQQFILGDYSEDGCEEQATFRIQIDHTMQQW